MQTVACHDLGLAAKDVGGTLPQIHQFEETELAFFMVKKQVNVGIGPGSPRAVEPKQIQMFDAELLQSGFVLLQSVYDFVACHSFTLSKSFAWCHFFQLFQTITCSLDPKTKHRNGRLGCGAARNRVRRQVGDGSKWERFSRGGGGAA